MLIHKTERLRQAVALVAPLNGIVVGTLGVSATVVIDFDVTATTDQRAAANAVVDGFDWSDAADDVWEKATKESAEPDIAAIRDQATQVIADINTFLAIANPSNAQVLAEVKAIDQRQRAIIKALARLAIKAL